MNVTKNAKGFYLPLYLIALTINTLSLRYIIYIGLRLHFTLSFD